MELGQQLLFFFSSLGVFNGLLMSLYFLFVVRPKRLQNLLFGMLLLMLSVRIGKSVLHFFTAGLSKTVLQIGLSACVFIGPFLWLYIRSVRRQESQLRSIDFIHLSVLLLATLAVGLLFPYANRPELWNPEIVTGIYLVWIIYTVIAGYEIRQELGKLMTNRSQLSPIEKWLLTVWVTNALICLVFNSVLHFNFPSYILGPITFSFVFYGLMAFILFSPKKKDIIEGEKQRYAKRKLESKAVGRISDQLSLLMNGQQLYKDPSLKLENLAHQLEIKPHTLSQFLNDNLGKSFSSYINEFRVKAASEMITTENHLTLEGIGQEVGFRSKSSFYAAFKKQYGTTPSQYSKMAKAQ